MKQAKRIAKVLMALGGMTLLCGNMASAAHGGTEVPNPDFTQGGKTDGTHDWTLGQTGARGWMFARKGQTAEARQILVTAVAKGSPADGILNTGDVILGIDGKSFAEDARIRFANAITAAEQEKADDGLKLVRWRAGKTDSVSLKLAVMGGYSATAPYDCRKSRKIFDLGCEAIAKRGLGNSSIPDDLNALALLASGKAEYLPVLKAYAGQHGLTNGGGFEGFHDSSVRMTLGPPWPTKPRSVS